MKISFHLGLMLLFCLSALSEVAQSESGGKPSTASGTTSGIMSKPAKELSRAIECAEELSYYDPGGQAAGSLDIKGNLMAFGGSLTGLNIMDISEPGNPQLLSKIMRFGIPPCDDWVPEIFDVALKDEYLYATYKCPMGDYSGIIIFNITDPTDPLIEGIYHLIVEQWVSFFDMDIYQTYAFIALRSRGLAIFDISSPSSILQIWHDDTIGNITKALVRYQWLYSIKDKGAYGGELLIYDISSIANPIIKKIISFEGVPQDIAMEGNILYLIQWIENQRGDLLIFNVEDPMNIINLIGEYIITDAVGMRLDVKKGIVGISATHLKEEWPYQSGKIIILNCNRPSDIHFLSANDSGTVYLDVGYPFGDAKINNEIFFISGNDGIKIFDFSECMSAHRRPVTKP